MHVDEYWSARPKRPAFVISDKEARSALDSSSSSSCRMYLLLEGRVAFWLRARLDEAEDEGAEVDGCADEEGRF